ncbi:hypothetical protein NLI96_g10791 [Meripilus lineatus]|uniref:Uncharacterized protein n=1 Tax=Meripilus lineatus TaxID=2056292 RepID=A0AAD5YBL9_9APHY|nr:hypothetical protein NLI96_g10791 [Physisporinus lineatus]
MCAASFVLQAPEGNRADGPRLGSTAATLAKSAITTFGAHIRSFVWSTDNKLLAEQLNCGEDSLFMAAMHSEDAQPNEVRLGRKGDASVPTIRCTHHRIRSRGQRRHYVQVSGSRFHASNARPGVDDTNLPKNLVNSCESRAHSSYGPSTELLPWDRPNARKWPRRHTDDHKDNESITIASPKCQNFPRPPHWKTGVPSNAVAEVILVVLPPWCRGGGKRGREKREKWVQQQLNMLRTDRGLEVTQHRIKNGALRVTCVRPPAPTDPQTIPSEAASSSSVLLPSGRASPLPRAQIQGHEAFSIPNNWTDGSESPHPSGSIPQYPMHIVQSPSRFADPSDALRSEFPATSQHRGYSCFSFRSGTLVIAANNYATRPHEQIPPPEVSSKHIEPPSTDFSLPFASESDYPEAQHGSPHITPPLLQIPPHPQCLSANDTGERTLTDFEHLRVEEPDEVAILSRDTYDKPRRLLLPRERGLVSVTMRGTINYIDRGPPSRGHLLLAGNETSGHLVEDACSLDTSDASHLVVAFNRSLNPISLLKLTERGTQEVGTCHLPLEEGTVGGVTSVTALDEHRMFASGEYNHRIHLWSIPQDPAEMSGELLGIGHRSVVQSLLFTRDTSDKLLSAGADCSVNLWDLSSERTINTFKTSNSVYHAHRTPFPFCTLLEVAHRDLQFEIRDHRLVPEKAVQRFGHAIQKFHGRHAKGDVHSSAFACGDREGVVRFWDLRNVGKPSQEVECFPGRRILQVKFDKDTIAACSEDHHIAFMKYKAERVVDVTAPISRAARKQDAEKAYEVQVKAGTQGAVRYASIGTGLVILGHYTWPLFRRQTLAFKAFLVTGFAFFGLSIYAEHALQSLEAEQRYSESIIRKEARIELARRGLVPTETAIAQWKAERLERMKAAENQAQTGTESTPES